MRKKIKVTIVDSSEKLADGTILITKSHQLDAIMEFPPINSNFITIIDKNGRRKNNHTKNIRS